MPFFQTLAQSLSLGLPSKASEKEVGFNRQELEESGISRKTRQNQAKEIGPGGPRASFGANRELSQAVGQAVGFVGQIASAARCPDFPGCYLDLSPLDTKMSSNGNLSRTEQMSFGGRVPL